MIQAQLTEKSLIFFFFFSHQLILQRESNGLFQGSRGGGGPTFSRGGGGPWKPIELVIFQEVSRPPVAASGSTHDWIYSSTSENIFSLKQTI